MRPAEIDTSDYRDVLMPAVRDVWERGDEVRIVLVFERWDGMSPGAAWEDLKVGMEHLTKWKRIALVIDLDWMITMTSLFGRMTPGELRRFPVTARDMRSCGPLARTTDRSDGRSGTPRSRGDRPSDRQLRGSTCRSATTTESSYVGRRFNNPGMTSWRDSASPEAQNDLDQLLVMGIEFAQQQLSSRGEFAPYAAAVGVDGQLRDSRPPR